MSLQSFESTSPARLKAPRSLFQFLTFAGGLKPHPDLATILDGKHGWMVRKSGMSLDDARIACIEEGFLQDNEEREHEPSINDLLELIAAEASGHKQYRVHETIDAYEHAAAKAAANAPGNDSNGGGKPMASNKTTAHTMRAAEYKKLRDKIGISASQLSRELGISIRQGFRYEAGDAEIPVTVARLLRLFAKHGIE
jgi:DNA-binding transcriptional regulator YiaG